MVYRVAQRGTSVAVTMTFTSIGCPAIEMIVTDVHQALRTVPGVESVTVDIVWDPPWTRERITERGRRVLAVYGVVC